MFYFSVCKFTKVKSKTVDNEQASGGRHRLLEKLLPVPIGLYRAT